MNRSTRQLADLVTELVVRDVRLRYRRTVLGVAWSQLAPLSLLAVLTFVFTVVVPLDIEHYAAFVFAGLLAWTWFQDALVAATASVVNGRELVRRPRFPAVLLPVAAVTTNLAHFAISVPVLLLAVLLDTGRLPLTTVGLPVVMAAQFVLLLGPAFLLATLNVRFRDTTHLVTVLLRPLFYATPVFYAVESVPERYEGVYRLNPLTELIEGYRDVLIAGRWPDARGLALVVAAGAALGVIGHRLCRAHAHAFAEEL